MRLKLSLSHLPEQSIPINYQYLISSWIYHTIHNSDSGFAEWLHDEGYQLDRKKYKHFCFGKLKPQRYSIKGNRFILKQSPTSLLVSFHVKEGGKHLIKGVFQDNTMELKSRNDSTLLMVEQLQILKDPDFIEKMTYKTMTPIGVSISVEGKEHPQYLHPQDEEYGAAFISNLVNKANAYENKNRFQEDGIEFRLKSRSPRSKLWSVKDIKVRGYEYEYELKAPIEIQEIGYYAGFGIGNSSMGMGLVEINKV